jgi:UDP-glucose 4-epimerase
MQHSLSGQKVMVTGAAGFLGSHLCRRLCMIGSEVHGISRTEGRVGTDGLHWWQSDLERLESVTSLVRDIRPDVIFHLSGHVTAAPDSELVQSTFQSLLVSTVNLLTVAQAIGCRRIVLTGSLTEPNGDHAEATPGSPYAAAKWAANAYARMFHQLYKTPVTIVRPFMSYGPGQNIRKLVPYVTHCLIRGEAPKVSSGQWQADWIYVDDVINGLVAAACTQSAEGCTIDLGTGTLASLRTVVTELVHVTGVQIEPIFGALGDRPLEQTRAANVSYAYEKLGWKAATSLSEGLGKTVQWYKHYDDQKAASESCPTLNMTREQ